MKQSESQSFWSKNSFKWHVNHPAYKCWIFLRKKNCCWNEYKRNWINRSIVSIKITPHFIRLNLLPFLIVTPIWHEKRAYWTAKKSKLIVLQLWLDITLRNIRQNLSKCLSGMYCFWHITFCPIFIYCFDVSLYKKLAYSNDRFMVMLRKISLDSPCSVFTYSMFSLLDHYAVNVNIDEFCTWYSI